MLIIDGNTTVRELLKEHPNTFDVLVSHGMCLDCKSSPPPVRLEHFAKKHCDWDLLSLIQQVEAAIHDTDSPHS